ncbi:Galactokinase [Zostera marina]|uniref:Galactokinase n=1 Tax=Zostera marina TaxID=29655 RepID=A0A0K9PVA0_ZOSMR|nr:Galactokinase [Zostera marina]
MGGGSSGSPWPSETELVKVRNIVCEMSGTAITSINDVKVVISPYRICPLGAHIDHQGGTVTAMTINRGILLAFLPSATPQIVLRSGQFQGEIKFRVDEEQYPKSAKSINSNNLLKVQPEPDWGTYARGAVYALKRMGNHLTRGITAFISGSEGLDSSGLSSSAAVGVAYLLALESASNLSISPTLNIELDRLIENEYLGLRNGILDQSAILLSKYGCLTRMNCKTKEYSHIGSPILHNKEETYKILLAFSGMKHSLPNNPGYNNRVSECKEAAQILLKASKSETMEPLLCNVDPTFFEVYKSKLEPHLARRAEHYFSENTRVDKGIKAWETGMVEDFGKLISASGLSSINNYECGCEPLIQMYKILLRTTGVLGARFSGAGFRGCCLAIVRADQAEKAVSFVREEYQKLQPKLAAQLRPQNAVLICEAGDCAHII